MKKLLSILLASAMFLSLAVPCFAEDITTGEKVVNESDTVETTVSESTEGIHEITSSSIPFYSGGALLGEIPLYFRRFCSLGG